jgi:hypothetical protein
MQADALKQPCLLVAFVESSYNVCKDGAVLASAGGQGNSFSTSEQALADDCLMHLLLKHSVEALLAELHSTKVVKLVS